MKPAGAPVVLTYDSDTVVIEGDVIETLTGRRYLVTDAHRVANKGRSVYDERFPFRWRLDCVVMAAFDETPADATVHPLVWYRRTKRQT